ncbi:unnamed protein product [Blepharisma stoltei]|uniref:Uncharacterized protein n=1 Tax=Blepharisma stoltei TaxID=1481888 RepID=A0AAU9IMY6_9CILI|nr:unnamed protein product [Blepharisma stoltei]
MPEIDYGCNSVIFNGKILISGIKNRNLWFSEIPYKFGTDKRKILINAERLYLIESNRGLIYESEFGDEYTWNEIAESVINGFPHQVYYSYNKGAIYISCFGLPNY